MFRHKFALVGNLFKKTSLLAQFISLKRTTWLFFYQCSNFVLFFLWSFIKFSEWQNNSFYDWTSSLLHYNRKQNNSLSMILIEFHLLILLRTTYHAHSQKHNGDFTCFYSLNYTYCSELFALLILNTRDNQIHCVVKWIRYWRHGVYCAEFFHRGLTFI